MNKIVTIVVWRTSDAGDNNNQFDAINLGSVNGYNGCITNCVTYPRLHTIIRTHTHIDVTLVVCYIQICIAYTGCGGESQSDDGKKVLFHYHFWLIGLLISDCNS